MARLLAEHQIAWPAWSWDPSAQQLWKRNQLQTWEKLGKSFAAFAPPRDKQMPTFKKAYTQTKYDIATYVCCNTFIMAPSCVSLGACWRREMTKRYTEYLRWWVQQHLVQASLPTVQLQHGHHHQLPAEEFALDKLGGTIEPPCKPKM